MKASFTYAIRYLAEAECISPLRIGNADNDVDRILTTSEGFAMISGTSIAGAMKAWLGAEAVATELFGTSDRESSVRVTDAIFWNGEVAQTRPHVRLSKQTGSVAGDEKYDVAALSTGARCSFELLWCGEKAAATEAAAGLERCLGAMDQGEITLGAQHSNGYGRVKLSVKKRCYDLLKALDRKAWLEDKMEPAETLRFDHNSEKYTVFYVTAELPSILVKASAPVRKGNKQNVQVFMSENGRPILPGSSLKGAMRAHMERIADFLSVPAQELDMLLGRMAEKDDNGVSGKLVWTDATADETTQREIDVTRIRLNRITAGVMRHHLITEAPISGCWSWQILVPAELKRGSLLVLYALRDLGLGLYQLGGTQAVGRGTAQKLSVRIQCGNSTAEFSVDHRDSTLTDPDGLVQAWEAALGGNANEN